MVSDCFDFQLFFFVRHVFVVYLIHHHSFHSFSSQQKRGTDESKQFDRKFDYIIASDCIYLEAAFVPLIETLLDVSDANTLTFMSFQRRRKADNNFWKKAQKKFSVTAIDKRDYVPTGADTRQELVEIRVLKRK
jgi:hypothetical protein